VKPRLSLSFGQLFLLTILGLALLLGLLFHRIDQASRQSIVDSSEPLRNLASTLISRQVEAYLWSAEKSIEDIEKQIQYGSCEAEDALSVEAQLFAVVLENENLAEATLTHASMQGFDADDHMRLGPAGRWQVSVFRQNPAPESPVFTRFTVQDKERFSSRMRRRPAQGGLLEAPLSPDPAAVGDPTEHPTFFVTASRAEYARRKQRALWSDLSYTELDDALPEAQRRVVVTVMKAVEDRSGRFVGVVRVGLRTEELDRRIREEAARNQPNRIFLCDDTGRLITRLRAGDRLQDLAGDLRVVPSPLPEEIGLALGHPSLQDVKPERLDASGRFAASGRKFLVSFKGLPKTQGWRVGVVVAEDELPGIATLVANRNRLLEGSLAVMALILVLGVVALRVVQGGLRKIVDSTGRMRNFDFAPSAIQSPFRDVRAVMERLELAKTAMRAMGKYVPIDLVRLLYQTGREPVLGGDLVDVSIMFTDIKDFTRLSEALPPNELARVLGRYLEVMTATSTSETRSWRSGTCRRHARATRIEPAKRHWLACVRAGSCSRPMNGPAGRHCSLASGSTRTRSWSVISALRSE
jgi:adenylate cyclase